METGRMSDGPGSSGGGSSLSGKREFRLSWEKDDLAHSALPRYPKRGPGERFQMVIQIVTVKVQGIFLKGDKHQTRRLTLCFRWSSKRLGFVRPKSRPDP